jgi:hypothetical protein
VVFLVFGSSAAGKTTAIDALRGRLDGVAIHDFDEIGVPSDADEAWRRSANDQWLQRALAYQADGIDLLLAGQTPYGELLEAHSARSIDGIAACLVDCDDATRIARLHERATALDVPRLLSWAAWLRDHAREHRLPVLDTTSRSVGDVAADLADWISASRSASS